MVMQVQQAVTRYLVHIFVVAAGSAASEVFYLL
jgi:hypothetical protein